MIVLGVAVAGAAGAVARAVVEILVSARVRAKVPVGTLAINVTGSFVLGVITGLVLYHGASSSMRTVLGTGFCGGYTTFSTFAWETVALGESRMTNAAVVNVAASVVLSIGAAALGFALAGL